MGQRLYLLGRTALADARRLEVPPRSGDVVCIIRQAQDPVGDDAADMRAAGITVIRAEDIIDTATEQAIDALGTQFLHEWPVADGYDFSRVGAVSLAKSFAMEIARQINPRMQIRMGELLRRLIETHPEILEILTDIEDGDAVFEVEPVNFPLRRVLTHVASQAGLSLRGVPGVNPVPASMKRGNHQRWPAALRSLAGGLRLEWLRRRRAFRRDGRPVLYMFLGREQHLVARRLVESGRFHVVCDRTDVDGADVIRCDQLMALPKWREIWQARAALARIAKIARGGTQTGCYEYANVDYGPILFSCVHAVIKPQLGAFLLVLAQSRRLQTMVGFDALFINGGGVEPMGTLIGLNETSGPPIYLMPHGMDLQRFAYPMAAADNGHVTYLSYGSDHSDYFRSTPESPTREPAVVGNPLTVSLAALRDRRPASHDKRLLILSFGHLEFWNAGRLFACDQYYIELFGTACALAEEGWKISLRAHPYHPVELEQRLAEKMGMGDHIVWDRHETIEDALAAHDVVISNLSSAYYQSLAAGWPTIFFEPDWRRKGGIEGIETDPMLTGLPTASDLERPVTNDSAIAIQWVRDTLDPDSAASLFPEQVNTLYSGRFFGPSPGEADKTVAEFMEADFFGNAVADTDAPFPKRAAG